METESPQITQKKFWKKDILKHTDEKQQTTIIDANTNEERENDSADEDSSSSSKSTASFRSIDSDSSNSDSSDETYKPQVPVKKKKSAKKIKSAEETDTDMEDETQKKPKKIVPKSCYVRLTKNKQVSKATNETTTAATAATITTTDKYTNALHCTMIDKYTADIKSVLRLSNFYESLYNRHVQFLSHDNPTVSQCESMAKILQSERCRVEQINMLTESLIKVLQNYMVFEIAQKRIQGKEKVITIVEKMQKQLPGIGNTSLDGTIYTSLRNLIRQLNEKTSRNIVVLRSKERTDFDLMQLQSIKRPTVAPTRKFLEIYVQVVLRCVLKFKNDQIYLPLTKQLDRSWRRLSSSPLKYPKRFTGTLKPVKFWSEEYKRFYYLHKYLKCLNTKFSIYINHCDVMISKLKKETNTTTDETAADKRRDLSSSSTVDWPEQLSQPQHNTKNGFSLLGSKYWKKITSSTEPYEFMLETQEEYEQQTQQCIDSPNPSPENPLLLEDTIQTISKNNVPLPDQLRSAPSNSGCNSGNLVAVPPRSASSSSSSSLSQPAQIQILKRKNTDVQQQQQKKKRTNSIGEKLKLRLAMANLLLNKNTEENTIASQKRTNDKYTPLERTVLRSFFFEQDEQNQESFLRMVNNIEFVFYDLERFYLQQKILTTTETPSLFNDVISLLENQLAVFNLLNETELHPVVDTGKRNDEYTLLEQKMLKKYFIQLNAAEQENLLCRTTSVSFL